MAIVIEEERNRVSPLTLIGWGVILLIIVISVYYIFFRSPESIVKDTPADFRNTEQISKLNINLDAETITNHPGFRSRIQYVTPPVVVNLGRSNPFISF